MKILDFTNKEFNQIQFNNETLIVMAHQRKIITFNDSGELDIIKSSLESMADYIDDISENEGFKSEEELERELIDGYCKSDIVRMLVDELEEESYFLESKCIEPRGLKVTDVDKFIKDKFINYQINFDSNLSVFYGYLNSSDSFLKPEWYKVMAEALLEFSKDKEKCKNINERDLLIILSKELLFEEKCYKNNMPIFKVVVDE